MAKQQPDFMERVLGGPHDELLEWLRPLDEEARAALAGEHAYFIEAAWRSVAQHPEHGEMWSAIGEAPSDLAARLREGAARGGTAADAAADSKAKPVWMHTGASRTAFRIRVSAVMIGLGDEQQARRAIGHMASCPDPEETCRCHEISGVFGDDFGWVALSPLLHRDAPWASALVRELLEDSSPLAGNNALGFARFVRAAGELPAFRELAAAYPKKRPWPSIAYFEEESPPPVASRLAGIGRGQLGITLYQETVYSYLREAADRGEVERLALLSALCKCLCTDPNARFGKDVGRLIEALSPSLDEMEALEALYLQMLDAAKGGTAAYGAGALAVLAEEGRGDDSAQRKPLLLAVGHPQGRAAKAVLDVVYARFGESEPAFALEVSLAALGSQHKAVRGRATRWIVKADATVIDGQRDALAAAVAKLAAGERGKLETLLAL